MPRKVSEETEKRVKIYSEALKKRVRHRLKAEENLKYSRKQRELPGWGTPGSQRAKTAKKYADKAYEHAKEAQRQKRNEDLALKRGYYKH